MAIRVLGRDLAIGVWSPCEGELPLLVAHDGPEYDELAALTRYAGAMIEAGQVPPFRVALLPPGDRDEWYSASAAYGRALCNRILPRLREHVPVTGLPVGMGASLGGLAMLQAAADVARRVRRPVPAVGRASSCPASTARSPGFRATPGSCGSSVECCARRRSTSRCRCR